MEFRQIECFLAVVEHGGIVRAAAALHVAQPSLSQSIKGLEQELGTELFHRTGRGIALTPAGSALVKPARQVLRDVGTARASVAELADPLVGRVEMAAMPGTFEQPLVGLIGAYRLRHPDVTLRVEESTSESDLMQRVREGRVELGFGYVPEGGRPLAEDPDTAELSHPLAENPDTAELDVAVLGHDELCLAIPAGTGEEVADPVPLTALPDLPVIAVTRGAVARQTVEHALRRAGVRTTLALVTEHRHLELPLVAAGVGMAWITRTSAHDIEARETVLRSVDPPVVLRYGVFRRPGYLAPAAKAFWDLALTTAEQSANPV